MAPGFTSPFSELARILIIRAGLFRMPELGDHTGPCAWEALAFGLMLAAGCLDLLNEFISEPVSCQGSPMGQWSLYVRRYEQRQCLSLLAAVLLNSGVPAGCGSSAGLKINTREECYKEAGMTTTPRDISEPEFASNADRRMRRIKKHPTAKKPHHLLSSPGDLP